MPSRSRTLDERYIVVGALRYFTPSYFQTLSDSTEGTVTVTNDVTGNRLGANLFDLRRITKNSPFLNGQLVSGGVLQREMVGFPIGNNVSGPTDPRSVFGTISNATLQQDAWTAVAKTNPSQSHVNVPAALGELRDLPKLVKGYGDGLLRAAATGNLSWRWAIKPMISDVRKLCQFAQAANKRFRELKKLKDGKTLRKRCFLGTGDANTQTNRVQIHSNGATHYATRRVTSTYQKWATVEWKLLPDSDIRDMDDGELRKFANRNTLGINSHGALEAAWELTPWSWLIDWFSNCGEMLQATNNTVGCTWGRICVMRHSLSRTTFDWDPVGSSTWTTFDGWYDWRYERKERFPTAPIIPFPLPKLPILDGGKLSILLSLAALRR